MARSGRRSGGGDDPQQLRIDWPSGTPAGHTTTLPPATPSSGDESSDRTVPPLVQRLPWDFKTSFPPPTDEAIDSGALDESDREPENLKSLHENYFAQCLAILKERDAIMEAHRRQIDPKTGSRPRSHAGRERLRKYLTEEPGRLEHTFEILTGTYEEAFGPEAADAFRKAVIARHAGIEVTADLPDEPPTSAPTVRRIQKVRTSSTLPVPRPLRSSVAAAIFGHDEQGKPIRPNPDEVRALTENHAEKLIGLLFNGEDIQPGISKYAQDFGQKPAKQLEAYVRRHHRTR